MSEFHFLRPGWLLALCPALLLGWLLWRRQDDRRGWKRLIAPHLLDHLMVGQQGGFRVRPFHVLLTGWLLACFALAGPTWQREPAPFAENTTALVIVLKVTPSMTTTDVQPSRLARAVQKINDLLKIRGEGKTALVAYAGTAHLAVPLTADPRILESFAAALSPDVMPVEGDDPTTALRLANEVLKRSKLPGWILWVADSVAPAGQQSLTRQSSTVPVAVLVTAGEGTEQQSLEQSATQLGAQTVHLTADNRDVQRLARQDQFSAAPESKSERWRDDGYWLVPVLTVLSLLWFRPGWIVRAGVRAKRSSERSP